MTGPGWTPDFSAGVAELEMEAVLTRYHLVYRWSAVASGALRLLARPEDTVRPRLAWAALVVEAADAAFVTTRTRRWHSLLSPELLRVDTAVGVLAVALGTHSMSTEAQVNGTAWNNRVYDVRLASTPLTTTSPVARAVSISLQTLPLVVGRPWADSRKVAGAIVPIAVLAAAPTFVIVNRTRRHARLIDERAVRWVDRRIDDEVEAERAALAREVLVPASTSLGLIRDALSAPDAGGRSRARTLAAAEERRIRDWLAAANDRVDAPLPGPTAERMAKVEHTVRRISRKVQAGIRIVAAASAITQITRRTSADPRAARLATLASAARGASGMLLLSDAVVARVGERRANRVTAAVDVASVLATGAHQLAEREDRGVAAWVELDAAQVAATAGTVDWDSPLAAGVVAAVGAVRTAVTLAEDRPLGRRVAAAMNELVLVQTTAYILSRLFRVTVRQTRELTATSSELAAAPRHAELRDLRVRQRAWVHDGVAQVLAAVRAGEIDDARLATWIDQEVERVESALDGSLIAPASIEAGVVDLVAEFAARGLAVDRSDDRLPLWTRPVAGTVVEIVREALNNVVKHSGASTARVVWTATTDLAEIRVVDDGPDARDRLGDRPLGAGTAAMLALADLIGAGIERRPTAVGGTEVRIVVARP